jgi:O-acetyl-ADP-ribose deacetylase (regulator of RNase III)
MMMFRPTFSFLAGGDMEKPRKDATINGVKVTLVQGDLVQQSTYAIVNAANPGLMGGGGVDGAIHLAGGPAILEECKQIVARQGRLPTGKAVITTGGRLKARFVIHAVGPIWYGGTRGEPDLLASAYRESLKLAAERGLTTIAFPSISTGAYGYPARGAAKVALSSVVSFLQNPGSLREVVFVLYNSEIYEEYVRALEEIKRMD